MNTSNMKSAPSNHNNARRVNQSPEETSEGLWTLEPTI